MNNRQRKTLVEVFENPLRIDIEWSRIESLFDALGAYVREGNGSRVRITLNERCNFPSPPPAKRN